MQVGTLAYIVSFALGAGPVPGLLVPEITPTRLRGARFAAILCHPLLSLSCAPCNKTFLNSTTLSVPANCDRKLPRTSSPPSVIGCCGDCDLKLFMRTVSRLFK